MAKHIIYLKEGAEATFSMSQRILTHHGEVLLSHPPQPGDDSKRTMQHVHQMLAQKVTQFECWNIRMESMQKRMENVINLVWGPGFFSLIFPPFFSFFPLLTPRAHAKRYCSPPPPLALGEKCNMRYYD